MEFLILNCRGQTITIDRKIIDQSELLITYCNIAFKQGYADKQFYIDCNINDLHKLLDLLPDEKTEDKNVKKIATLMGLDKVIDNPLISTEYATSSYGLMEYIRGLIRNFLYIAEEYIRAIEEYTLNKTGNSRYSDNVTLVLSSIKIMKLISKIDFYIRSKHSNLYNGRACDFIIDNINNDQRNFMNRYADEIVHNGIRHFPINELVLLKKGLTEYLDKLMNEIFN